MEYNYFQDIEIEIIKKAFKKIEEGNICQKNIYHYTDFNALYNILDKRSIYFTSIEEQNDPLEIHYGLRVIKKIMSNKCKNWIKIKNIIDKTEKFETHYNINNIFIFATSTENDDYAQWIKYSNNGAGVTIRFDRQELLSLMEEKVNANSIVLNYPIQYYHNDQNISINKISNFEEIIAEMLDSLYDSSLVYNTANIRKDYYNLMLILASMIKDKFHITEKEWRFAIVFNPIDESDQNKIILKNNSLKMIRDFNFEKLLDNENSEHIIKGITLGPKHTNNTSMFINTYKLIKKHYNDFSHENIKFSNGLIR